MPQSSLEFPLDVEEALRASLPGIGDDIFTFIGAMRTAGKAHDPATSPFEKVRCDLRIRLHAIVQKTANEAQLALQQLDPSVVLHHEFLNRAANRPSAAMLRKSGLNRFMWAVGVGATGKDATLGRLCGFLDAAATWVAARYCLAVMILPDTEVASAISHNHSYEDLRRLFATEIRFTWVSELILSAAADEIAKDPCKYEPLLTLNLDTISSYFAELRERGVKVFDGLQPIALPSDEVSELGLDFSVPAGSLGHLALDDLLLSNRIERHPFVRFEDQAYPLGLREALFGTEQALFELARRRLKNGKDRGDLFEAVIARCLAAVAPAGLQVLSAPIAINMVGEDDPGEIDFAIVSDGNLWIGEAKAYFIANTSSSVINTFADQMGKAVEQLSKRIAWYQEGAPLTSALSSSPSGDKSQIWGLAVPLHSYATAVWNRDALQVVGGNRPDIVVIPLHQLIMVIQSMMNVTDLKRYMDYRFRCIDSGIVIFDEIDMLIGYLHGNPFGNERRFEFGTLPRQVVIFQPFKMDTDVGLKTPQFENRRNWRRLLVRECQHA